MTCLLDLPIEIFHTHIFPCLSQFDITWNVGFVCKRLQLYSLSFLKAIIVSRKAESEALVKSSELCSKLLRFKQITSAICHIVNRNNVEYELVEDLKLNLDFNQIILEIENTNLTHSNNQQNDCLIQVCKKCPHVETLISIGTNTYPNDILEAVSYLNGLKTLILFRKEKFVSVTDDDVISVISKCTDLEVIVLMDHNKITDYGITAISKNCKKLKNFNIHGCDKITDTAIEYLTSNCKEMQSLDLYGCNKLTDASLSSIAIHCKRMKEVDVGKCYKITDEGIKILSRNCKQLSCFDGSRCTALSDKSVGYLAMNCKYLEFLALEHCDNLTNKCITYIASYCQNLKHLDLNGCNKITNKWLGRLNDDKSDTRSITK